MRRRCRGIDAAYCEALSLGASHYVDWRVALPRVTATDGADRRRPAWFADALGSAQLEMSADPAYHASRTGTFFGTASLPNFTFGANET